jgi:hypothetical protein
MDRNIVVYMLFNKIDPFKKTLYELHYFSRFVVFSLAILYRKIRFQLNVRGR